MQRLPEFALQNFENEMTWDYLLECADGLSLSHAPSRLGIAENENDGRPMKYLEELKGL
jgi:hypothetical protein